MQEMKRIFRRKNMLFLLLCTVANLCLFFYSETRPDRIFSDAGSIARYRALLAEVQSMPPHSAEAYVEKLNKQAKAGRLEKEAQITTFLAEKIEYVSNYPQSISYVMENARKINRFSIFTKPNSFSYYNIQKTIQDFDRMTGLELLPDNDLATEAMAGYSGISYIAFLYILYILYQLLDERQNGMLPMIHAGSGGRVRLAVVRQLAIAGVALLSLLVLFLTTAVCAFSRYGGVSDLMNPVQTIASFSKYVYGHSKLEYLILSFFKTALVLYALSCLVWLLLVAFRDRKLVLGAMAGVYGLEYLLYTKISIHSAYRLFHHINILSLFSFGDISRRYLNVGAGRLVFPVEGVILLACAVLSILASIAAVLLYARLRPKTARVFWERFTGKIRIWGQKKLCQCPVIIKELYKILTAKNAFLLILLLLVLSVYFCADSRMHFSEAQQQLDRKYLEMGGKDYTALASYCDEIKSRLEQAQQEMKLLSAPDQQGARTEEYIEASLAFTAVQTEYRAVSEYVNKLAYLEELEANTGIHGYMMSDRGYEEILGKHAWTREFILLLCLSCVVVLLLSETFHMEYGSRMYHLMRSTENGRGWVFTRKCIAGMIAVSALFVLTYSIDFFYWIHYYGLPYLTAPVQSLYAMEQYPFELTILGYLLLRWLLLYVFVVMNAAFVTLLMLLAGSGNGKGLLTAAVAVVLAGSFVVLSAGMTAIYLFLPAMAAAAVLFLALGANCWRKKALI